MDLMNTRHALFVTIPVCKSPHRWTEEEMKRYFCFLSELAQKTHAEREAKRVLHEAGVAKKKEIIAHSVNIQSERQVRSLGRQARVHSAVSRPVSMISNEIWVNSTKNWKQKKVDPFPQIERRDAHHLRLELKRQAEAPETEAKDKHQKLLDGNCVSLFSCSPSRMIGIEQRAIREALAHDQQMRDMFADLDTNHDDQYVPISSSSATSSIVFVQLESRSKNCKNTPSSTPTMKMSSPPTKFE